MLLLVSGFLVLAFFQAAISIPQVVGAGKMHLVSEFT